MRIAISQREVGIGSKQFTHDCLEQSWYKLLSKHDLIPIPNVDIDCEYEFDLLVLTGGNPSLSRLNTELKLYNCAMDKGLPVVGFCHGAFLIAQLTGGTTDTVDGHRNTTHLINMEGNTVLVNSFHGSKIITIGTDYETIATDLDGNIEAFKHKDKPVWGVVWHPERMEVPVLPKDLHNIIS
jgi:putative glutamine amidotransferase